MGRGKTQKGERRRENFENIEKREKEKSINVRKIRGIRGIKKHRCVRMLTAKWRDMNPNINPSTTCYKYADVRR
jgi:hypothetical protein